MPAPSRCFAVCVRAVMAIRSAPFFTLVTGAVRFLPRPLIHSAVRCPFRVMIFAPGGIGFVAVFWKTVPIVTSLLVSGSSL